MENEQEYNFDFPFAGIDLSVPFSSQRPRPMPAQKKWGRTCVSGINVRSWEPTTDRMRGGSRQGVAKAVNHAAVPGWVIQDLNVVVGSGFPPPSGVMQQSNSGRVVTEVKVTQGNVYVLNPGALVWSSTTNATGATPPLNFTGVMFSTALNQKLWWADGTNWVYYDPSVNTVYRWSATAGSLPADSRNNLPRLICTWRGRMVLSGLLLDPQNWFMSAVTDPTNWDYFPTNITPTQAVAGNNSPLGLVGDVITGLIPYSDDTLIFGGDHTIYLMNGDPMAGGQIDLVSDQIGMAWGKAWCKSPDGTIWFTSNRTGIYTMVPGQAPVRVSQQIEQLLENLNTGETTVRMEWNDKFQGVHVFLSPTVEPGATRHLFYEARTGSWWQDSFSDPDMDPLCCCVIDGNEPDDRAVHIGSWDGYVRNFSTLAEDDDGEDIVSSVVMGPITSKNLDEFVLHDLQAVLGEDSGEVTYEVFAGTSPEKALSNPAVASGTWDNGRSLNALVRRAAHGIYLRVSSTVPWSMEVVRGRIAGTGKVRRRGNF